LRQLVHLMRGELRLGSSDSLCKYYLLPELGRFCSDYPQIRLDLMHGTTPEIIRHVKEGRIDFGIVRLPVEDAALTVCETIEVQDCFVAGPRYAQLAESMMTFHQLAEHPLILFTKKSSSRTFIESIAKAYQVTLEPEIELASVDLLIEFAKAGLGLSFVTRQFVQSELNSGALVEVKLAETIPPRRIGIVFLKNQRLTPATSEFIRSYLKVEPGKRATGIVKAPLKIFKLVEHNYEAILSINECIVTIPCPTEQIWNNTEAILTIR
jgi:LysR family cyn operon transcriptional activator